MKLKELLQQLQEVQQKIGSSEVFCCGGFPRDRYMHQLDNVSDLDVTTGDKTIQYLAQEFNAELAKKYNVAYRTHNDGHSSINIGDFKVDFSSNFNIPNIEQLLQEQAIQKPTDMQKEMFSRDFTCNALLLSTDLKNVSDPTQRGFHDIDEKYIRTCLSPSITLTTNKNRVIRAIYLACKLDFNIDQSIVQFVAENPETVKIATDKVLREKLNQAFEKDADKAVHYLSQMNLWPLIPITDIMQPYYMKSVKKSVFIDNKIIKNARINANEIDKKLSKFITSENNPNFFFSMTEINKIGINPQSKYDTPLGVYCYPLTKDYFNKLLVNQLPFAGNKRFIKVFSISDSTFNLAKYSEMNLFEDTDKLHKIYPNLDRNYVTNAYDTASSKKAISKFWNLTRLLSGDMKKWNFLLRKLGYTNFYDPGTKIIHPNEPTQCVILDPSIIIEVETLLNPFYNEYDKPHHVDERDVDYKIKSKHNTPYIPEMTELDLIKYLENHKHDYFNYIFWEEVFKYIKPKKYTVSYIVNNFLHSFDTEYNKNILKKYIAENSLGIDLNDESKVVNADGDISYYNSSGELHRISGPAVIKKDGTKKWYVNGQLHKLDGPAVITNFGDKIWFRNNLLHRLDGPAMELADGEHQWWINGKKVTEEEFNSLGKSANLKNILNKYSYFQGGGGVNEPTPKKTKYKAEKRIVDQPRFKEPLYTNYDLYDVPGEHGPGAGWHDMHKYKSISEFLKAKRKKLKNKYKADDSYINSDGKITKGYQLLNQRIKLAIDFPADQYIDPAVTMGGGSIMEIINPAGVKDQFLPPNDLEDRPISALNYGEESDEGPEGKLNFKEIEKLLNLYLNNSFYGDSDGVNISEEELDNPNNINPYYGTQGPNSKIYKEVY